VFVAIPDLMISQLFFPIKGIPSSTIGRRKTFAALPGADDPEYVQTNAGVEPGRQRDRVRPRHRLPRERLEQQNSALVDEKDVPEFTVDKKPFRYDLYRIRSMTGRWHTGADRGRVERRMSNYFPKYSPTAGGSCSPSRRATCCSSPTASCGSSPPRARGAAPAPQHAAHELLAQLGRRTAAGWSSPRR